MLYLVQGTVRRARYMGEAKSEPALRLVEAESSAEAGRKFEQHFNDQSSEYSVSVSAWAEDISAVIT